ncbi:MAG: adenylate/guanylate cyclase domain-containing protein [Gammaproteobacteria bacterium]
MHFFYKEIQYAELQLENEHRRSESLLLNILPEEIAAKLKDNPSFTAEEFDRVTILFADIVGFTEIANKVDSTTLVDRLNEIFTMFDSLAEKHGLEKIKTIGDAYMVAGGVPKPMSNHTEAVARMALDMIESTSHHYILEQQLNVRIGFHTGSVIAGVIGTKKFSYDIWGDAVNTASRLESHGEPGKIHVSHVVYEILKDEFEFKSRGEMSIKGLGIMKTYYLTGIK